MGARFEEVEPYFGIFVECLERLAEFARDRSVVALGCGLGESRQAFCLDTNTPHQAPIQPGQSFDEVVLVLVLRVPVLKKTTSLGLEVFVIFAGQDDMVGPKAVIEGIET
jgi:hypothetical protein